MIRNKLYIVHITLLGLGYSQAHDIYDIDKNNLIEITSKKKDMLLHGGHSSIKTCHAWSTTQSMRQAWP
jgi:hypothetical protein